MLAVTATVATYVTRIKFTGWSTIENAKLRAFLTFLYTALPGIFVYILLTKFVDYVVKEVVRSQMLH
jgi:hypothetical protein